MSDLRKVYGIQMNPVVSSNIEKIGRNNERLELFIQFKGSPKVYCYGGVDEEIYQLLLRAESIGSAFANQIKCKPDIYPHEIVLLEELPSVTIVDPPRIVIYHAGCWDGFCAAWIMRLVYPNAEFHPANHGSPPPNVKGKRVMILDFSYSREVLIEIQRQADGPVLLLDHHISAQKALEGLGDECVSLGLVRPIIIFDMAKSGGRITWEKVAMHVRREFPVGFLQGEDEPLTEIPWIVAYTEDRDLWRFQLPHSKEINSGLRTYPLDFEVWDELILGRHALTSKMRLAEEGVVAMRRDKQIIDSHVRHARETLFFGCTVRITNVTVVGLVSEICSELAEGVAFGMTYFIQDGGGVIFSLRASESSSIDVSAIATIQGGGGHKKAAGFKWTLEQFVDWQRSTKFTNPNIEE